MMINPIYQLPTFQLLLIVVTAVTAAPITNLRGGKILIAKNHDHALDLNEFQHYDDAIDPKHSTPSLVIFCPEYYPGTNSECILDGERNGSCYYRADGTLLESKLYHTTVGDTIDNRWDNKISIEEELPIKLAEQKSRTAPEDADQVCICANRFSSCYLTSVVTSYP